MKHILVASDLSPRSDRAVARAVALARRFGATLTVLHAVDDELPAPLFESERRQAAGLLAATLAALPDAGGVRGGVRVVGGLDFQAIVEAAEDEDAALIVLGTHRRNLLKDVFTGTTVERVVRNTTRPVLVARGAGPGAAPSPYVCTLAAVDLTAEAADVVRMAHRLADGQTLYLLHVIDDAALPPLNRADNAGDAVDRLRRASEERGRQGLHAIAGQAGLAPGDWLPVVEWSAPLPRLTAAAATFGADLVVVGTRTHTKGMAERLLLGSVAEQALRDLPCDVLALPLTGETPLPDAAAITGPD